MSVNALTKLVYAGAALSMAVLVLTAAPVAANAATSNGNGHVYKFNLNSVPRYKPGGPSSARFAISPR